jgi:hypothetical protein
LTRPAGLTIIAILWFLGGIVNLYVSSTTISGDLEVLPLLSDPMVPEWFKFGVPAEIGINLFAFSFGIIQMFTIVGLWTGKSWSYKMALTIPVLAAVSWIAWGALFMSAPIELGFRESTKWVPIGASIFWAIIILSYLRKPHVKEYLSVTVQKTLAEKVPEAPEIPKVPKRRRRILMVIAVLAIVIVVASAGIGLYVLRVPGGEEPSPTPIEYETYSKYGFSIEYPKGMSISEQGMLESTATSSSGVFLGELSNDEYELITLGWLTTISPPDLEIGLNAGFESMEDQAEEVNKGQLVTSTKAGHTIKYQNFTATIEGETVYGILGVWYCDTNDRFYNLGLMYSEQDVLPKFQQYLESFVCH